MSGAWDLVQAKHLFDAIDKDNTGTITYKELLAYNKKNSKTANGRGEKPLTDEQWHEIFELMDADHSGAINRKEFEKCRNDIGGEWTVANFNKNFGRLRSKALNGSQPTSPSARPPSLVPTTRSPVRNCLPQMSGVSLRLLLPAQMAAFLCVLDRLRSRQLLPPCLYLCPVSLSLRNPSASLAFCLFLLRFLPSLPLPLLTPLTFSRVWHLAYGPGLRCSDLIKCAFIHLQIYYISILSRCRQKQDIESSGRIS
jgi:Ca2+-binding EF-hand superfamily protein